MSLSQLTSAHLKRVAKLIKTKEGFLAKVALIDDELESFATGDAPASERVAARRRKRKPMSAATKAKMREAAQKRWAKQKKSAKPL